MLRCSPSASSSRPNPRPSSSATSGYGTCTWGSEQAGMHKFINFTLDGFTSGMIYAALAMALVLIWRATRIVNFAQGAMAMLTTYIAFSITNHGGNYWLAFFVALASGLIIGP